MVFLKPNLRFIDENDSGSLISLPCYSRRQFFYDLDEIVSSKAELTSSNSLTFIISIYKPTNKKIINNNNKSPNFRLAFPLRF